MDSHQESTTPRRKRKVLKRLEQILEVSAILFATKGYHRTTTKDIAEAAQVSEGTLYNYFDSKNDLLFAIFTQLAETQAEQDINPQAYQQDARQLFTAMLRQRRGTLEKHVAMQQTILAEILTDASLRERYYEEILHPLIVSLEKQLELRLTLGQIRDVDPALAARVLSSILGGMFILQIVEDPVVLSRWDELVDTAASIVFEGLEG